ncbi:hypothetical protein A2230_06210 [candidate division WOR-1 bacterium RIFOXYA2_FULL_36_21]|uniref:UDP-N-acetylmuramoyl-tripeptide--D-alanyl-D-alanine ligase n=1 Tax=candidate division WOR-1 bacterium RIFOXYB2_FULL_36_35 TaxID=1802578 RepID=A0A1F4S276_UNCSA|nr:MAG: hypothetical protein A2230_06210 [candidate division WOR-1 bacterium RIFOXYA2_FULL_36_21]OGC14556.1 MAG: hypothetical protein A2290_01750 [candidate division WOR-1 bacterium RIFOXYB2_FULL_36_35]OGC16228.1 MAG: hypothetical protein A2282_01305 [candidate division WOR-1 bacterium RIFOXYA12_FULL_36_13]
MFSIEEILKAANGKLLNGNLNQKINSISTDTREIKKGDAFLALKGPKFDGHNFLDKAIKKGAAALIVSKSFSTKKAAVIKVKNTLKAIQDIAHYHRMKFDIPVICVTGSAGKTTTKDMIASVLSQELNTLKTKENFNNEIGVPLTLLNLRSEHKAAVIEMGMQKKGEIKELAAITAPTIAVITNIGEAHLKYFKNKKEIAKTKSEIFSFLKPGNTAILPEDDKYFKYMKKAIPKGVNIITFGRNSLKNNITTEIRVRLPGNHNLLNALVAVKIAKLLKVNDSSIIKGLRKFKPSSKRMEIIKRRDGITIINDSYNANPLAMKAALTMFASYKAKTRIALLGDMLELGKNSKKLHLDIGKLAKKLKIDLLITIGKESKYIKGNYHFTSNKKVIEFLRTTLKKGVVLLVKGSRGMKLDYVVDALRA